MTRSDYERIYLAMEAAMTDVTDTMIEAGLLAFGDGDLEGFTDLAWWEERIPKAYLAMHSARQSAIPDGDVVEKIADLLQDEGEWCGGRDDALKTAQAIAALKQPNSQVDAMRDHERAAIQAIVAERQRQIEDEGWSPEHDDTHGHNELAHAAACYAIGQREVVYRVPDGRESAEWAYREVKAWPWDREWWKPGTERRRQLVKAGALIVAEIERLDRAALQPKEPSNG